MRRMLWAIVGVALGFAAAPAAAQSPAHRPPVLAAADLREHQSLDGPWHWSVDPYRDGEAGFHGGDAGTGHRRWDTTNVEQAMERDPTALYEYDMQRSPVAQLPGAWIGHSAEMRYYNGLVWYQRAFKAAPQPGERAFLRFGAVNIVPKSISTAISSGATKAASPPSRST